MTGKIANLWHSLFGKKTAQPETKQPDPEPIVADHLGADIWQPARELHTQLKRGWDSAAKFGHIDLVEVGFDNFGNLYFVPAKIMSIPVERLIAIDEAKLGIFHGLEEPYITAYNKALREQIDAKNLVAAGALLTDFERRKAKFPKHEVLLNLATLFLFRHDENPYNYSPTMQQEKLNLAKKDPELRSFFLRVGWGTITQAEEKLAVWSGTSEQDFINYSANQTAMREDSPTILR